MIKPEEPGTAEETTSLNRNGICRGPAARPSGVSTSGGGGNGEH